MEGRTEVSKERVYIVHPDDIDKETEGNHLAQSLSAFAERQALRRVERDIEEETEPEPYVPPRPQNPTLIIRNLTFETTRDDLYGLLTLVSCGDDVVRLNVPVDRTTGRCRGFGFITFHSQMSAEQAQRKLHGKGFQNLILDVSFA